MTNFFARPVGQHLVPTTVEFSRYFLIALGTLALALLGLLGATASSAPKIAAVAANYFEEIGNAFCFIIISYSFSYWLKLSVDRKAPHQLLWLMGVVTYLTFLFGTWHAVTAFEGLTEELITVLEASD
ncbi:MAG: hypothetical protein AAF720_06170 [Pseudomonadota bacterium]